MANARLLKQNSRTAWLNGLLLALASLVSACGGGGGVGHWEAVYTVEITSYNTSTTSAFLSGKANAVVTVTWANVTSGASGATHQRKSCSIFFGHPVLCHTRWDAEIPLVGGPGYPNRIRITASKGTSEVAHTSITLAPVPDTTPPEVSSTVPTDGAIGVAINHAVMATFTETMNATSVTTASFIVRDASGTAVDGSVTISDMTATFNPTAPLAYETTYTATLTTAMRDPAGNALASDYAWQFTTGIEPDTTPPSVSASAPADAEGCAAVESAITATFDEPMDRASINESTFLLKDASGDPLSGAVSYAGNTARFDPYVELAYSTQYSGTITREAKDIAGNTMGSDYVWNFTTVAPTGSWQPIAMAPLARIYHTSIWTGREMIVWGGAPEYVQLYGYLNWGSRYDPVSDTWLETSTVGAPMGRVGHVAVWTGSEMIVWGGTVGAGQPSYLNDTGGRYDPITNTWRSMATLGTPYIYPSHAVWTGDEMIVVGPSGDLVVGARYDPASDVWQRISTIAAHPSRGPYSFVWTGDEIIVWGGRGAKNVPLGTGARYDPHTNTWTPVSTEGAPSARFSHSAVWTGSEMIVWGGEDADGKLLTTGGKYNPLTDTWQPLTTRCAPVARKGYVAAWAGSRMVIWGGFDGAYKYFDSGGAYDPTTDSWTATSIINAPEGRVGAAAIWTGDKMIVWGGADSQHYLGNGGSYSP